MYATARKIESMEGFTQTGIRRRALDVTDNESVQRVVDEIIAEVGHVDILVNNAGVICIGMSHDRNSP